MRNEKLPIVQTTEIVGTLVTHEVVVSFTVQCCTEEKTADSLSMKNIDHYLKANPDLLMKKFIFFTINKHNWHWSRWTAVNLWVQIARVLYEQAVAEGEEESYSEYSDYANFANGLISCDGLGEKGPEDARCVIWFLNLASAYRDMAIENKLKDFNFWNHTTKTFYMLGCSGPFGILDMKNDDRIAYKILELHKDV